jgi:hypothetical protein
MRKCSLLRKITVVALILIATTTLSTYAQGPGDPGGGPSGGDPPVGAGVPLDGGAIALLIAGAAYGIKSLRKKKGKDQ